MNKTALMSGFVCGLGLFAAELFAGEKELCVSGYRGTETLTDFPVLVKLPAGVPGFSYADAQTDGSDLYFTDAEGTVLAAEIDTWDAAGDSFVWVRIPALTRGTRITAHWGGEKPSAVAAKDTWSKYIGVWHMKEADKTSNKAETDATGNGLDLSPVSGTAAAPYAAQLKPMDAGVVGKSVQTTELHTWSSHGGNALRTTSSYASQVTDASKQTIGMWVKATDHSSSANPKLFSTKSSTTGTAGGFEMRWNGQTDAAPYSFSLYGSNATENKFNIAAFSENKWVYLSVVCDGSTVRVYANGDLVKTITNFATVKMDSAAPGLAIGSVYALNHWMWGGQFDEVRLYDGAASADRVRAEYDTMAAPTAFLTEAATSETIVFSGYSGTETLTNFPALIELPGCLTKFSYAMAAADGSDVWFSDAEGNVLCSEVDTWNAEGKSFVWVKVPELTRETEITAHWGGERPSAVVSKDTWSKYIGVWHMKDADKTSDTAETDATGNGFDLSPVSSTAAAPYAAQLKPMDAGVVGKSVQTTELHTWYTYGGNALRTTTSYASQVTDASKQTIGMWVKATDRRSDANPKLFSTKSSTTGTAGGFEMRWNGSTDDTPCSFSLYGSNATENKFNIAAFSENKWVYLSVVCDGSTARVYANGDLVKTIANFATVKMDSTAPGLAIGSVYALNHWMWGGQFDEVRLYDGVASSDRVCAEYMTMQRPTAFAQSAAQLAREPADAPVNHLTFDGTLESEPGTTAIGTPPYNQSGNPSYVTTEIGQALTLDTNMYPYGSGLGIGSGSWTCVVRAKSANLANGVIVNIGSYSGTRTGLFLVANGNSGVSMLLGSNKAATNEGRVDVAVSDAISAYHTYGIVYSAGVATLYVDGVCGGSMAYEAYSSSNAYWEFGSAHGGYDSSAQVKLQAGKGVCLDDFRIYQRILTPSEQTAIAGGLAGKPACYAAEASGSGRLRDLVWEPLSPIYATADDLAVVTMKSAETEVVIDDGFGAGRLEFVGAAGSVRLDAAAPLPAGGTLSLGEGQTLDVNARNADITLEMGDGTTVKNTASALGNGLAQLQGGVSLRPGAVVSAQADRDFGVIGRGYAETFLRLNGGLIDITGAGSFWLYHVTGIGEGTIRVTATGGLELDKTQCYLPDVTIDVRSKLKVKVPLTVARLTGTGTVESSATTLTVNDELDAALVLSDTAKFTTVTLGDGARLDLTHVAETYAVPTRFGKTATIDVTGRNLTTNAKVVSWSEKPDTSFAFVGAPAGCRPKVEDDGLYAVTPFILILR